MTNEEFQRLVVEKLVKLDNLEATVNDIKSSMATKDDIARLDAKIDALDAKVEKYGQIQQNDVYGLLKVINDKTDRFETKIDILAHRLLEQEVDIQMLKKVR